MRKPVEKLRGRKNIMAAFMGQPAVLIEQVEEHFRNGPLPPIRERRAW